MTNWIVDNKINLNELGAAANWNRIAITDSLMEAGLSRDDASSFADFVINEYVISQRGITDHTSEECVNEAQYDRLTLSFS